jgi:predicted methyltransferase
MGSSLDRPTSNYLSELSSKMRLKEGEEAVRKVLLEIYRKKKIGTKDLARAVRLPIPVTAAIRRELEKSGIVSRKGGAVLSDMGREFVVEVLGFTSEDIITSESPVFHPKFGSILNSLKEYTLRRPIADPALDQAYATPETSLHRALFILKRGNLEGIDIILLGDDDLTSVAIGFLRAAKRITVIDIDNRILKLISEISEKENLGIECINHDLRKPLPKELRGAFDTFFTDPPYTTQGLNLFLSRGIDSLKRKKTSYAYFAYPDKPPLEMLKAHDTILRMGAYIDELSPRFNLYEGAEILGNTTSMFRIVVTEKAKPAITGNYSGEIYTGELNPTIRTYLCKCGERIKVGATEEYATINIVKTNGCPKCGKKNGFRLVRKESI